jgi:hypothetical protein
MEKKSNLFANLFTRIFFSRKMKNQALEAIANDPKVQKNLVELEKTMKKLRTEMEYLKKIYKDK